MLTNTTMDWAQKYGNAYNYGYTPAPSSTTPATTEEMDGYVLNANGAIYSNIVLMLAGPFSLFINKCSR